MKSVKELEKELHNRRTAVTIGLVGIAAVHIADLPAKWDETSYLAWMYIGAIIASAFLVDRLVVKTSKLDYLAALLLSASVFAGYIINRSVGMPGASEDIGNWFEPLGFLSLFIEISAVWHSFQAYRVISCLESHPENK